MKAYIHLVKFALASGAAVNVFDGEEWSMQHETKFTAIKKEIEDLEECSLRFSDKDGNRLGTAFITPFEPAEETVCDYSCTPFMEKWANIYYQ